MACDDPAALAHVAFERQGTAPANLLPPDIYESWMRCVAAGLDPRRPPPLAVETAATLRQARERHELVRRLALAEMHTLHHQIAGTNFVIAFAAPDGLLLDILADQSFAATPHGASIRPGSLWAEGRCGTNALGTVAQSGRPVVVHGPEHFFPRFGALTCIASPVFAPDGTLAGVLDASSDCHTRQRHTQALVAMAATQIENGLLRERHRGDIVVAFHSRAEYLHTLSAGLFAIDQDGRIKAANAQARGLLQGLPSGPEQRFDELFRTPLDGFLSEGRSHDLQRLEDGVGSVFVATVENPRARAVSRRSTRRPTPTAFVAADIVVASIVREVEAAAARRMPILIRGETGTGKEQLARHAHSASRRRGAFVPVNCAALPESLIEAELFGYVEGAFTGARRGGSVGLVKEADGGTLFLDEIGTMPVALQAVLLRFLDDWTVHPVGGTRRKVDVLLIAATNARLDQAMTEGRFRADLFYRLNTVDVTLPPLVARSDFAAIVHHLLNAIDPDCEITSGTLDRLAERTWPGNIRELRNMLARLSLAAPDGIIDDAAVEATAGAAPPRELGTLRTIQRARVLAAHRESDGNVSETARRLGISRNTVYRALGQTARD